MNSVPFSAPMSSATHKIMWTAVLAVLCLGLCAPCLAAAKFSEVMDVSADPCENFYAYACGSGMPSAMETDETKDPSEAKRSLVKSQLIELLSQPATDGTILAFKKAKTLFQACTSTGRREELGLEPGRKVLSSIGDWALLDGKPVCNDSSKCDWKEISFKLMDVGIYDNYLADIAIAPILSGSNTWVLNVDRPIYNVDSTFAKLLEEEFLINYRNKFKASAEMFMDAAARSANINRLDSAVAQIVDFEVAMSKLNTSENASETFTVNALQARYPFVPWTAFIERLLPNGTALTEFDVVVVEDPKFLDALQDLMKKTSNCTVANYVVGRVLLANVLPYLNAESRRIAEAFGGHASGLEEKCLDMVHESMPILTTSMYVRRHIRDDVRVQVTEMVRNIMAEMKLLLQNEAWLDERTRQAMKEKLDKMKYFVGYPDELLNDKLLDDYYRTLELHGDNLLEDVLSMSKMAYHHVRAKFNTSFEMMDWDFPITWIPMELNQFINAQYVTITNSLTIFPGFLSKVFKPGRLDSVTYGQLGTIIGHEIAHALDTEGTSRNGEGTLEDLWKSSTAKNEFDQRVQGIVEQFDNIWIAGVNAPVNGTISRDENMADITGQLLAYRAYLRVIKAQGGEGPGLRVLSTSQNRRVGTRGAVLSARQLFWVSYASVYCSAYSPHLLNLMLLEQDSPHLPDIYRVTGSLRNHKEFAADFACPAGARMNPSDKRLVWGFESPNVVSRRAHETDPRADTAEY